MIERLTVCVQPKRASPSSVTAWSLQVARPVPINNRHRLPATFMDNRHVEWSVLAVLQVDLQQALGM